MAHLFRLLLLFLGLAVAGCATYGWADAGSEDAVPITVQTLQLPPHLGVDASRLRALLVEEFERLGTPVVDDSDRQLRCHVDEPFAQGTDGAHFVEIQVLCHLFTHTGAEISTHQMLARGMSSTPLDATGSRAEAAQVATLRSEERAIFDALIQIAQQTTRHLTADPR